MQQKIQKDVIWVGQLCHEKTKTKYQKNLISDTCLTWRYEQRKITFYEILTKIQMVVI